MPAKSSKRSSTKKPLKKEPIKGSILSLEDSVKKAIKTIKTSAYKGTFVKVELEAQINRNRSVWDDSRCAEYILDNISQKARSCLVFGKFYVDGSVDSEYTFTVPLDNVYEVLEYIKAFKKLAQEAGTGMSVKGAGMHIAILTNPDGVYPEDNGFDQVYAKNFAYSMTKLIPALFFLGSSNAISRGLNYRPPKIDIDDKYAAITGHAGVFEYRVFETCYNKPEAFLDFFCVIAKSLQFFSPTKVTLPFFDTIGKLLIPDNGYHLSRFYFTANHLKALDLGLAILKPDHKTIEQLKKERNFQVTEDKIVEEDQKLERELNLEFEIVQRQFKDKLEKRKQQLSDWYDQEMAVVPELIDYSKDECIKNGIDQMIRENSSMTDRKKYIDVKKANRLSTGNRCYSVNV